MHLHKQIKKRLELEKQTYRRLIIQFNCDISKYITLPDMESELSLVK